MPSEYTLHLVFECIAKEKELLRPADDVVEGRWIKVLELNQYLDERESLVKSSRLHLDKV